MSWLYDHKEQLDGLRPFVEIAHHLIYPIPYRDRDDVEQEIVITLKRVTDRRGETGENYLWGAARNVVKHYWRKRYRQARRLRYFYPSNRGEMIAGKWMFVSEDGDIAARQDAIATLATLPQRLVEIGYKRLNGERLSEADELYWMRHKAKLDKPNGIAHTLFFVMLPFKDCNRGYNPGTDKPRLVNALKYRHNFEIIQNPFLKPKAVFHVQPLA